MRMSEADSSFVRETYEVLANLDRQTTTEGVIAVTRRALTRFGFDYFCFNTFPSERQRFEDVTISLVRVTKSAFSQLLREQPDFAATFVASLVRRSICDQESLVDHLTNSADKRLARTLLQLATEVGGDNAHFIPEGINQALLASMIGTTRSRVSVFLNKFKRQGLIAYARNGQVSVHKPSLGAWLKR